MFKAARKNIAARLAVGTLAVGLVAGGAQAVEVANAETADAYYWGNCSIQDAGYGYGIAASGGVYRYGKLCQKKGITFWEWAAGHRETWHWVQFAHTRSALL